MTDDKPKQNCSPDDTVLVDRLRHLAMAYPEDVFIPFTPEETRAHSRVITRASGAMGRHMSQFLTEAANEIERLTTAISNAADGAIEAEVGRNPDEDAEESETLAEVRRELAEARAEIERQRIMKMGWAERYRQGDAYAGALVDVVKAARVILGLWSETELDPEDDEYESFMAAFNESVTQFLSDASAALEKNPNPSASVPEGSVQSDFRRVEGANQTAVPTTAAGGKGSGQRHEIGATLTPEQTRLLGATEAGWYHDDASVLLGPRWGVLVNESEFRALVKMVNGVCPSPNLRGLLVEARATLEMWKDVAPAVSLCSDIDVALAAPAPPEAVAAETCNRWPCVRSPIVNGRCHNGHQRNDPCTTQDYGFAVGVNAAEVLRQIVSTATGSVGTSDADPDEYRADLSYIAAMATGLLDAQQSAPNIVHQVGLSREGEDGR